MTLDSKQIWFKLSLSMVDMAILTAPESLFNKILGYPKVSVHEYPKGKKFNVLISKS